MHSVLVADDEQSIRLLVTVAIASDKYAVLEASNGDQAWELIQQHRPDVALLNVQMPGDSGLELARLIKSDPELRPTYVILLSALSLEEDVATGLQAGADLYLTKPFSPLELCDAVERALGLQSPPSGEPSDQIRRLVSLVIPRLRT